MGFDVSHAAANAVLYGVLCFFTLLAFIAGGYLLKCIPERYLSFCLLNRKNGTPMDENDTVAKYDGNMSTDHFLSARNSANARTIGLSYFAAAMGAWVVYGTTEMGANPQLSWLGVLGYSFACSSPAMVVCLLAPRIRTMCSSEDNKKNSAFCTADFGRKRYGRVIQLVVTCISGFSLFIGLVAEFTSISGIFAILTSNFSQKYAVSVALSVGLFTTFYTAVGGTPASIITDKFQGFMMGGLVLLLTFAVTLNPANAVTREEFAKASNWTLDGFYAAITLNLSIICAEMFNQGTWQRVWAAESVPALKKGLCFGAFLNFMLMMFFGIMGMLAYAKDPEAYDNGLKYSYLAFFDLLEPLKGGWHILTLILVVSLNASTVDTLQNAASSLFSSDLVKIGWNPTLAARVLIVAVNIPAIYLATKAYSVLSLFLVANLVCATSAFPVYLGLQTKDYYIFTAPTELGAFLGCIAGIVAVLVNGVINGADGGLFAYFWLRNGAICALCGTKTLVSFIVTPLVSLIATYVFSYVDVKFRGDRARQPIFQFSFDAGDTLANTETTAEVTEQAVVKDIESDENPDKIVVKNLNDDDEVDEVHA